jgi:hypothetical protein
VALDLLIVWKYFILNLYLIMEEYIWILSAVLAAPLILSWIALNLKRLLSKKGVKKWGFFHPFW